MATKTIDTNKINTKMFAALGGYSSAVDCIKAILDSAEEIQPSAEPVCYLRFRQGRKYIGNNIFTDDHWYEECKKDDIGDDGTPAFPVYKAATPVEPAPVECEPVAEVLWYEPILHEPQTKQGHKIIDASMAWMDRAPLGTKLYERPPHGIDAETRAMVLELLTVLDYAMFEFADTEQKVRELKNKIRERIRS